MGVKVVVRRVVILIVFFCGGYFQGKGQQNKTLFLMHDLPQSNFVNPAVGFKSQWYFGVPVLASQHYNYSNTAFSVKDLIAPVRGSDSLAYTFDRVVGDLHNTDLFSTEIHLTLLSVGLNSGDFSFTFDVNEKINSYSTVPRELVMLGWDGNAQFEGEQVDIGGTRASLSHYREFALGGSKRVDERWRLGVKAKLLFGKSSVYTSNSAGEFYTHPNSFVLETNLSMRVNSSMPINVVQDEDGEITDVELKEDIDWVDYAMNAKNMGVGFDFGFVYNYDELTTFSGSLLDVGFISWRSDLTTLSTSGTYSYAGAEIDNEGENREYFEHLGDSLKEAFMPVVSHQGYNSRLVPRLYLGATREFMPNLNGGVMFYSEFYRNKIHPSLALSLNSQLLKNVGASVSWSAQNSRYDNIGIGVGVKMGQVHFHAVTDNLPGLFFPENTRNVNLRFGFSILAGKERSREKKEGAFECIGNPYGYSIYKYQKDIKRPKKKKRKRIKRPKS